MPRARGKGEAARRSVADAVPIEEMLAGLGYSGAAAQREARRILEAAGLTNPTKQGIHPRKRAQVEAALAGQLVRLCSSQRCLASASDDGRGRRVVRVERGDCEVCGGQPNRRAVAVLQRTFARKDLKRLLVLGGAPDVHAELRALLGTKPRIRLDLVDGARAPQTSRVRALAQGADVIVIWGSTILPHSVTNALVDEGMSRKTITVTRRGIQALVDAVVEHCEN